MYGFQVPAIVFPLPPRTDKMCDFWVFAPFAVISYFFKTLGNQRQRITEVIDNGACRMESRIEGLLDRSINLGTNNIMIQDSLLCLLHSKVVGSCQS